MQLDPLLYTLLTRLIRWKCIDVEPPNARCLILFNFSKVKWKKWNHPIGEHDWIDNCHSRIVTQYTRHVLGALLIWEQREIINKYKWSFYCCQWTAGWLLLAISMILWKFCPVFAFQFLRISSWFIIKWYFLDSHCPKANKQFNIITLF